MSPSRYENAVNFFLQTIYNPRGLGTYCLFLLGSTVDKVQKYSSDKLYGKYKADKTVNKKFLQALG